MLYNPFLTAFELFYALAIKFGFCWFFLVALLPSLIYGFVYYLMDSPGWNHFIGWFFVAQNKDNYLYHSHKGSRIPRLELKSVRRRDGKFLYRHTRDHYLGELTDLYTKRFSKAQPNLSEKWETRNKLRNKCFMPGYYGSQRAFRKHNFFSQAYGDWIVFTTPAWWVEAGPYPPPRHKMYERKKRGFFFMEQQNLRNNSFNTAEDFFPSSIKSHEPYFYYLYRRFRIKFFRIMRRFNRVFKPVRTNHPKYTFIYEQGGGWQRFRRFFAVNKRHRWPTHLKTKTFYDLGLRPRIKYLKKSIYSMRKLKSEFKVYRKFIHHPSYDYKVKWMPSRVEMVRASKWRRRWRRTRRRWRLHYTEGVAEGLTWKTLRRLRRPLRRKFFFQNRMPHSYWHFRLPTETAFHERTVMAAQWAIVRWVMFDIYWHFDTARINNRGIVEIDYTFVDGPAYVVWPDFSPFFSFLRLEFRLMVEKFSATYDWWPDDQLNAFFGWFNELNIPFAPFIFISLRIIFFLLCDIYKAVNILKIDLAYYDFNSIFFLLIFGIAYTLVCWHLLVSPLLRSLFNKINFFLIGNSWQLGFAYLLKLRPNRTYETMNKHPFLSKFSLTEWWGWLGLWSPRTFLLTYNGGKGMLNDASLNPENMREKIGFSSTFDRLPGYINKRKTFFRGFFTYMEQSYRWFLEKHLFSAYVDYKYYSLKSAIGNRLQFSLFRWLTPWLNYHTPSNRLTSKIVIAFHYLTDFYIPYWTQLFDAKSFFKLIPMADVVYYFCFCYFFVFLLIFNSYAIFYYPSDEFAQFTLLSYYLLYLLFILIFSYIRMKSNQDDFDHLLRTFSFVFYDDPNDRQSFSAPQIEAELESHDLFEDEVDDFFWDERYYTYRSDELRHFKDNWALPDAAHYFLADKGYFKASLKAVGLIGDQDYDFDSYELYHPVAYDPYFLYMHLNDYNNIHVYRWLDWSDIENTSPPVEANGWLIPGSIYVRPWTSLTSIMQNFRSYPYGGYLNSDYSFDEDEGAGWARGASIRPNHRFNYFTHFNKVITRKGSLRNGAYYFHANRSLSPIIRTQALRYTSKNVYSHDLHKSFLKRRYYEADAGHLSTYMPSRVYISSLTPSADVQELYTVNPHVSDVFEQGLSGYHHTREWYDIMENPDYAFEYNFGPLLGTDPFEVGGLFERAYDETGASTSENPEYTYVTSLTHNLGEGPSFTRIDWNRRRRFTEDLFKPSSRLERELHWIDYFEDPDEPTKRKVESRKSQGFARRKDVYGYYGS